MSGPETSKDDAESGKVTVRAGDVELTGDEGFFRWLIRGVAGAPGERWSRARQLEVIETKFALAAKEIECLQKIDDLYTLKAKALGWSKEDLGPIPHRALRPIVDGASSEDEPVLQDLWANLLVNYTRPDKSIEPSRFHLHLLNSLDPPHAVALKWMCENNITGIGNSAYYRNGGGAGFVILAFSSSLTESELGFSYTPSGEYDHDATYWYTSDDVEAMQRWQKKKCDEGIYDPRDVGEIFIVNGTHKNVRVVRDSIPVFRSLGFLNDVDKMYRYSASARSFWIAIRPPTADDEKPDNDWEPPVGMTITST